MESCEIYDLQTNAIHYYLAAVLEQPISIMSMDNSALSIEFSRISYIYCATFSNGKVYIGQAINFKARISGHRFRFKAGAHSHLPIYCAWKAHGEPEFTIVGASSIDNIDKLEEHWIEKLKSRDREFGYNLTGGTGTKGISQAQSTKDKIGAANKKARSEGRGLRVYTTEQRAASAELIRKLHTREIAQKISDTRRGKHYLTKEQDLIKASCSWKPIRRSDGLIKHSVKAMAEHMRTTSRSIYRVLIGQFKQHHGFTFEYISDEEEIERIKQKAIEDIKLRFNPDHILLEQTGDRA